MSCVAPGCKSGYGSSGMQPGISSHRFPKDRVLLEEWIKAIPRSNWYPTSRSILCSLHFEDEDFITERTDQNKSRKKGMGGLKIRRLKKGAVPSKFPNVPSKYFAKPADKVKTETVLEEGLMDRQPSATPSESSLADQKPRKQYSLNPANGQLYQEVIDQICHDLPVTWDPSYQNADFPPLLNDIVIRAALMDEVEYIPVWMMLQSGRDLLEFSELKLEQDYYELCRTPESVCQITLQPLLRFDLDAVVLFSDVLIVPQALGMDVKMFPLFGPTFTSPLREPKDLYNLVRSGVMSRLQFALDAITLTRQRLNGRVPLIGIVGAPWTLMSYMIEGRASYTMTKAKKWLYVHSKASHALLQVLTNVIVEYLIGQVLAGAQVLQIMEMHAEFLTPSLFDTFCLPYLQEIAEKVREKLAEKEWPNKVPMAIYAKGGSYALTSLSEIGYDIVSLDPTVDPRFARGLVLENVTLQGNLDPCALYASANDIRRIANKMAQGFGRKRWIANVGLGINPDVDQNCVDAFIRCIHEWKKVSS